MQKQYIVQKYVLAGSVSEAIEKLKKMPVHEAFVHNAWFDRQGYEWEEKVEGALTSPATMGFKKKKNG